jgi:Toxin SymE, type I toxin-antitoxin system
MSQRRLTVSKGYQQGVRRMWGTVPQRTVPLVRLTGEWLAAAGFAVGETVLVEVKRGRLVLTVAAPARRAPRGD